MDIPALGEENLAKNLVENEKKNDDLACPSWREREREKFENIWKKWVE